jgi:two-component system, NtrC family, sensor kinase
MADRPGAGWRPAAWWPPSLPLVVTALLLCLGFANVVILATQVNAEDGVFWVDGPDGVTAAAIAPGTAAARTNLRVGDVLLAIDDRPVEHLADLTAILRGVESGTALHYMILRLGTREIIDARLTSVRRRAGPLYFVLAAVGTLTLLVGAAARLRRPRDPATLHFFCLAAAFFSLFVFSYSGRLDRLDWVFYWIDVGAILLLPPLFLHFTLIFPERPRRWSARGGRWLPPLLYAPAAVLGLARVAVIAWSTAEASRVVDVLVAIDRLEFVYLVTCLGAGFAVLLRGLASVTTITARRQLRWIAWGTALGAGPFAVGYALPWALGLGPSLLMELSAVPLALIPLAFASAIVRYRLLDIEVIVKRMIVYVAALTAVIAIVAVLLEAIQRVFLRDSLANPWAIALLAMVVAVLLAPPVKAFVQTLLDRAFYRDRYDYRRALVGFARDLNSDLDLHRLAERLVSRVVETLLVDRMVLMLADEASPWFGSVRAAGFGDRHPPPLSARSAIGERLAAGHLVALDDRSPSAVFPSRRSSSGATPACTTSSRASRPTARLRCWPSGARTPASRCTARTRACSWRWRDRSPRRSRTRDCTASCTSRRSSSIDCTRSTRTSSSRSTTGCS